MVFVFKIFASLLILGIVVLAISTFLISRNLENQFPPIGDFRILNNAKMHFVDSGKTENGNLPAVIFIHGASSNLNDPKAAYDEFLNGKFRTIYLDRPGQGYSEAFSGSNDPKKQANSISLLMDELEIEKAIIVGHSFGGVVTAAFGVLHPEKTAGLVFLAPVSHPWGTGVDWHYDVGNTPILGWLFSNILATPAGHFIYPKAVKRVFLPNTMPEDYPQTSATKLAIRPANFYENAKDVARVIDHVTEFNHRYKEISAPTYIFHGDQDDTVSLEIHSINGLSKDIKGSKLFVLEGVGHKPDYVAREKVVKAISEIAGF